MLPIALSVLLSSQSHLLKVFERLRVDVFHAGLANYVVCVTGGALLCRVGPAIPPVFQLPWFPLAAVVGVLLIASFRLTGLAVQRVGATAPRWRASSRSVVPVTYSLVAYQERSDPAKLIGIGMALLAVVLTTRREEGAAIDSRCERGSFPSRSSCAADCSTR